MATSCTGCGQMKQQRLQLVRELAPVGRDRSAAVVAKVDRRVPVLDGDRLDAIVAVASPVLLVEAEPVHDDEQPPGGACQRVGRPLRIDSRTVMPEAHLDRERVPGAYEVIAVDPVDGRDPGVAGSGGLALRQHRGNRRQPHVEAPPDDSRRAADAAINEAREPARGVGPRRPKRHVPKLDRVVHLLDQVGDADRGVDGESRGAAQVVHVHPGRSRHAGCLCCQSLSALMTAIGLRRPSLTPAS